MAVNVFSDGLDILDAKSAQIASILNGIKGASDVQLLAPPGLPQFAIKLRLADLAHWGLSPVEVAGRL